MLRTLTQRRALLVFVVVAIACAVAFHLFERRLSRAWVALGVHPETLQAIEEWRDDQKRLAQLDPAGEATYRRRFDDAQQLLARLRVLSLSRQQMVERYELALLVAVVLLVSVSAAVHASRLARQERRLAKLQDALAELAAGRTDLRLGERRKDLIGRIAAMVEETSRRMAGDRRRLASLENLEAWQEAARRHAHEIRTPLAAARLELGRLGDVAAQLSGQAAVAGGPAVAADADTAKDDAARQLLHLQTSLAQELDRLATFTRRFTSFAKLPEPSPLRLDLGALVGELVRLFAGAWPELELRLLPPGRPLWVLADPEMVRQVLVNLADNSALALREAGRTGVLTLSFPTAVAERVVLAVADDGPGIAAAVRPRLFEPYTTSRRIGEGMGLGLAIARKILLDHGGDLELVKSDAGGTTFALVFPAAAGMRATTTAAVPAPVSA